MIYINSEKQEKKGITNLTIPVTQRKLLAPKIPHTKQMTFTLYFWIKKWKEKKERGRERRLLCFVPNLSNAGRICFVTQDIYGN